KRVEDERGNLFLSIINLVKQLDSAHKKPRVLFLENVKNLKNHDEGRTYKVIRSEIEKLGYTVKEQILNTMDYSCLPQNRERIYIICFLNKEDANSFWMFDNIKNFKIHHTIKDRENQIKKIVDYCDKVSDKYYYTKSKYPNYFLSTDDYEKIPEKDRNNVRVNLEEQVNELYQFYQVRRGMYVRKNKSNVCPTLTANMGTGGHNVPLVKNHRGVRKLTPAETLRLQGFPVGSGFKMPERFKGRPFADSYLYKQAGNAVSVPVIELIATELLSILAKNDENKKMSGSLICESD
ncbi:MAG: DNA (cytosine-5-)-methyltransferase, partial [Clostridia bacterium]